MATPQMATLVKVSEADLSFADPNEDIRGRKVVDRNGHDVGKVEDLMIDQDEHKVRLLLVGSGGFLGLGETRVLIPVDAITGITEHEVQINQSREHVGRTPNYDPDLLQDEHYWGDVYDHYGYSPYWGGGYTYPGYPYYRNEAPV